MNVPSQRPQSTRSAEPRKRRSPPRRTPAIIEHRERKPFIFGWGAHLNAKEREALKERIALFGGIGLAVVIALLFGWGWYQDNIAGPNARAAENNKVVAKAGSQVITMGYFKRFEKFQQNRLNTQLQQIQQNLTQAQANPKKYGAQISLLQQQQSLTQQQLGNIGQNSLEALIDYDVILQRAPSAGVTMTSAELDKQWKKLETQAGGPLHLQTFIKNSGLTADEIRTQIKAEYLQGKLSTTLQKTVPRTQVQVRASHILIATTKKSLATTVFNKARSGANFAALAKKYSTDPGSAKKGGDLGYFGRGVMVAPFEKAVYSMKKGEIRLVQSSLGWHIIKLTGRKNHRLTAQEYKNAQQNAFGTWLEKQKAIIGVQHMIAVQNLPGSTSPTSSINGLQGQNIPGVTNPVPVPKAGKGVKSQVLKVQPSGKTGKTAPKVAPAKGSNGTKH